MPTVYDLTLEQLTDRLVSWGEPAFRAKQVWTQLWKRAVTYEQMSDVSPALRERLATDLPLGVEVLTERTADRGATRKALIKLGGQHVVEAVLMGYPDRVTVCVSSQAGCAMGCTFRPARWGCRTTSRPARARPGRCGRAAESARLPDTTPQRLTNIVFMGMGEAIDRCSLLSDGKGDDRRFRVLDLPDSDSITSTRRNVEAALTDEIAVDRAGDDMVHALGRLRNRPPLSPCSVHT